MAIRKQRNPAKRSKRGPLKRPRKKKASVAKRGLSMIYVILATALIVLIFYFIFSAPKREKPVHHMRQEKPLSQAEVVTLPEKPKEKWLYQSDLVSKVVNVDIPEKKISTKRYQIQCGSFRIKKQADALKAKIAFQALHSEVTKTKTSDWYRVILGPYKRRRNAEKDRHKLQRAKIYGCYVWQWR